MSSIFTSVTFLFIAHNDDTMFMFMIMIVIMIVIVIVIVIVIRKVNGMEKE